MKRISTLLTHIACICGLFVLLHISELNAQQLNPANQWIQPGQTYIKISVTTDGVYRLRADTLGLGAAQVSNVRLFHRGVEQVIYVEDVNANEAFDGNDFIEFIGHRNDGLDDREIYKNPQTGIWEPSGQANPYYSLYSDTAAYFLTNTITARPSQFTFENVNTTDYGATPAALAALPQALSCRFTSHLNFTSTFNNGDGASYSQIYSGNSDYTPGEGYTGGIYSYPSGVFTQNLLTPSPYSSGNPAIVTVRVKGVPSNQNNGQRLECGNQGADFPYAGITVQNLTLTVPASELGTNTTQYRLKRLVGAEDGSNRLCYHRIEYDRQFVFNSASFAEFTFSNSANADMYARIFGLNVANANETFVYDVTHRRRIRTLISGSDVYSVLPKPTVSGPSSFAFATDLHLDSSNIRVSAIKPSNLAGLSTFSGAEYLIITCQELMNSANSFATYRDTSTVRQMNGVRVIYTDQIFDEFGYGSPTPLAIKRFLMYAQENWTIKPKFVMMWGKARHLLRGGTSGIVPTWGEPASDIEFCNNYQLDSLNLQMNISIGRFNALNDEDGAVYLAKVNEYEHTPYETWMKRAIHLGGGKTDGEVALIRGYLEGRHQPIYEGAPLGGEVFYYQKLSNSVIGGTNNTADVRQLISEGVGLIQVFAHSTATIFEVELLDAFSYNNFGRYPFIIANGCYTGNFVVPGRSFGESYMAEPGRGAIGYLSTTTAGYIYYLGEYTDEFYANAYRDSIGSGMGELVSYTINKYCADNLNRTAGHINQCRTCNLQGDPALRLYHPPGPDLAIESSGVKFQPENFPSNIDSFNLELSIQNRGLSFQDSFHVRVVQTVVATGAVIDHGDRIYPAITAWDTLMYTCYRSSTPTSGLNRFDIYIDARDSIVEFDETNNHVVVEKLIPANAPVPLFPYPFAIVKDNTVRFTSCTYEPSARPVTYEYEVDTSHLFNSSFRITSGAIAGTALYSEWMAPISLVDSSVYYWRVRLVGEGSGEWATSSFKYIEGTHIGWAQSRWPQFAEVQKDTIRFIEQNLRWQFENLTRTLTVMTSNSTTSINSPFEFYINNGAVAFSEPFVNGMNGILYCIIDGKTLQPRTFFPGFGNIDVIGTIGAIPTLINAINSMNEGDYLMLCHRYYAPAAGSPSELSPANWPEALWQALESCGANSSLRFLPPTQRFIMLGRKGSASGTAQQITSPNTPSGRLQLLSTLSTSQESGQIRSQLVGPSREWRDLNWGWWSPDLNAGDEVRVSVFGVRSDLTEDLLIPNITQPSQDLSTIDANQFPYLRLQSSLRDPNNRSAPQFDNWHVHYAAVPEALVDPTLYVSLQNDTVDEGDNITYGLAARNISAIDMDSLLVRLQVRKADNSLITLQEFKVEPLLALRADTIYFVFNSSGLAGVNQAIITINPGLAQPEQYLFNNSYAQQFVVNPDRRNPILDITFDGRRIMDGDIVSPSPEILIQANDENEFFLLDDPSLVEVFFKPVNEPGLITQLPPTDPRLEFIPASGADNKARLYFRPQNLADGLYELEVQSFDRSGNAAGRQNYKITFEVVNRSTISHVVNYPNPFSTRTRFVYRLTGATLPEVFRIQIYTVSGRLVKTIDLAEMGEVAIGQNITNYEWDGTDEYGDVLANGVYLYRVQIQMPGDAELELNGGSADQYFERGWGKMVILR